MTSDAQSHTPTPRGGQPIYKRETSSVEILKENMQRHARTLSGFTV